MARSLSFISCVQRFVRDREFVADTHMALYLLALRNIGFALGPELLGLSVPPYTDVIFVQKLLTFSRKKTSSVLPVRYFLLVFQAAGASLDGD